MAHVAGLVLFVCLALNLPAQEEMPKLLPPHSEIPPTFWEQHGMTVVIAGVVLLLLVALGIWVRLRPKPAVVIPVEDQVRTALEALRKLPEDGAVISGVSQVLRRYIVAAFELPPGEYSTAEFRQLVSGSEKVGGELSSALSEFLLRCDEQKFARANSSTPAGAAGRALELVALGEARRAYLREIAAAVGKPAPAHA